MKPVISVGTQVMKPKKVVDKVRELVDNPITQDTIHLIEYYKRDWVAEIFRKSQVSGDTVTQQDILEGLEIEQYLEQVKSEGRFRPTTIEVNIK